MNIYDFKNFGMVDIPYVTIDMQGNQLNMVVDSGCGVSLLNAPSMDDMELLYRRCDRTVSLSAITEDRVEAGAITVDFNIGDKEVTEDFFMQDSEDFGNFRKMYGITIHGLLGASFFDRYKCKIDFERHQLVVP